VRDGHKVLVILVNWNGWMDTADCIDSCRSLDYPDFETIVVDNGSSDDSVARLRERFPALRIVPVERNLGFAGGNNVAIRIALQEQTAYVWLLNNDTLVAPDSLSALVQRAECDGAVGAVGSKIRYAADPDRLWYAGGEFTRYGWTRHRGFNEIDRGQFDTAGPTGFVTGCSMLVPTAVVRDVGLMDEDYFLYWEEVDWNARIARSGRCLVYEPRSIVWHKVGASTGGEASPLKSRYEGRNRVRFYRVQRPALAAYVVATSLAQSLWAAILGRPRIGAAIARGVWDGIVGRKGRIAP